MRVCQEIEQKMAATEKQIELNRTEISSNLEFLLADSPADEEQSHKDLLPRELADAMNTRTKFILEQVPQYLETGNELFTLYFGEDKDGKPRSKVLSNEMML